ncbi:MAG: glycosyltransferase [Bacteroidales bacterium]|nr:glycosyltransferase [Bacteroidales bacterium]MCF8396906.1 glycosyltransferase [Bacteroidales bacterium]
MKGDIKRIAMLSTHGYFDPVPVLGRTDTGGQVVYVLELAKALSKTGIKVDIYTRWFDKNKPQLDPVPGFPDVNVIRISAGPWEFIPKEKIYDVLPELSDNMLRYIRDNELDYDLFHGHYIDAGIVSLNVAEALKKPAFFTAHSIGAWKKDQMGGDEAEMEERFNFKYRIAEEIRVFKNINAQSVTSIVQLEKINELYNFFADNIAIIPPGVDVHHFKPVSSDEADISLDLPEKYIYCISRIDSNKGHDFLLRAFDIVRKKLKDVDLVIGGGSPNPKDREKEVFDKMNQIIEECGMQNRGHILGYVPDELMAPYYRRAELFVLPSLFEPFGMTTQEAMACGTPVVASKYGGIRTVLENGIDGMLVDPSDAEEFAGIMIKILTDKKLRRKLSEEGYKTVHREFSWEAIADKFLKFYREYM